MTDCSHCILPVMSTTEPTNHHPITDRALSLALELRDALTNLHDAVPVPKRLDEPIYEADMIAHALDMLAADLPHLHS